MDPNKTLDQLRTLVAEILHAEDGEDTDPREERDLLAEWFDALDSWLTSGGFAPSDWQDTIRAATSSAQPQKGAQA